MELLDYEKKHIEYLKNNAHECTLFLKKDNAFPLSKPGTLALYGNGVRHTIKGGTGSGDVASRFFHSFEEGLTQDGFTIMTQDWLDAYDKIKADRFNDYVKRTKKESKKYGYMASVFSMGYFDDEPEYSLPLREDAEIAIYVLSRESGEGNDRKLTKGDIYLTDTEIRDIHYLDKHYDKFMLVLNVGGVIDLEPLMDIRNILYVSQLGVVTGDVLGNIILGKTNPSGKLTTTWAGIKDYSTYDNFGDLQDVKYEEGIYVGYRYFDTVKKDVLFPFGYGLSYSSFAIHFLNATINKSEVSVKVSVKNTSDMKGKEVVQLYMSSPQGKLEKAYQELVAFAKTKELLPHEEQILTLTFNLENSASYSEMKESYILEAGNYILRVGNSSRNTQDVAYISNKDLRTVKKCKNLMGESRVVEMSLPLEEHEISSHLVELVLEDDAIKEEQIIYKKDDYVDSSLETLSDENLMMLTLGHHDLGMASMFGTSCKHVVGGAGETALCIDSIKKSITMADGPAGLRLKQAYGIDAKGMYDVTIDPIFEKMTHFLPKAAGFFMNPPKNRHGEVHYQYTTAIPIGTALAQSFNKEFIQEVGSLVGEEMEYFGVNIWLAPALNIQRNIRCGRNFEYYSEDPFLSGACATAMVKGVQSHKHCGVSIKHFLANNKELNRNNNNSHVRERTLREIYLRGFEYCMKESDPFSLMTSYNLINGVHTSESYPLLNDIVRCELHYDGLIMTDWMQSGRTFCKKAIYPAPYAAKSIKAGNELTMPGSKADERNIKKALKNGDLTRHDLLVAASKVYRAIQKI